MLLDPFFCSPLLVFVAFVVPDSWLWEGVVALAKLRAWASYTFPWGEKRLGKEASALTGLLVY